MREKRNDLLANGLSFHSVLRDPRRKGGEPAITDERAPSIGRRALERRLDMRRSFTICTKTIGVGPIGRRRRPRSGDAFSLRLMLDVGGASCAPQSKKKESKAGRSKRSAHCGIFQGDEGARTSE